MITVNARGARTINEARPLMHNGSQVYVTVGQDFAELHLGGRIVAERPASQIQNTKDAQDWAYQVIEAAADQDEVRYEAAAEQIRQTGAAVLAEAAAEDVRADAEANRKTGCTDLRNPRHPRNRADRIRAHADHLRKTATVLAAWTAQDEKGYNRYVSDGVGDTDGYFAPLTRTAWKRSA